MNIKIKLILEAKMILKAESLKIFCPTDPRTDFKPSVLKKQRGGLRREKKRLANKFPLTFMRLKFAINKR